MPTATLSPLVQHVIDHFDDTELAEAADLCQLVGIPPEYAANVAAIIATLIVTEDGV